MRLLLLLFIILLCIALLANAQTVPPNGVAVELVGPIKYDTKRCVLSYKAKVDHIDSKLPHAATYEIDMHAGVMRKKGGGKNLPFSEQERVSMHQVFARFLLEYAAVSAAWYEEGGPLNKLPPGARERAAH